MTSAETDSNGDSLSREAGPAAKDVALGWRLSDMTEIEFPCTVCGTPAKADRIDGKCDACGRITCQVCYRRMFPCASFATKLQKN
jgi:hypothetical protein